MTKGGFVVVPVLLLLAGAPALADDTTVGAGETSLLVSTNKTVDNWAPSAAPTITGASDNAADAPPPPCNVVADTDAECTPVTVCMPTELSPTGGVEVVYAGEFVNNEGFGSNDHCTPGSDPNSSAAQSLPLLVLQAFQQVPLPEPKLDIQPPKGKTLIGLETIFSTKAEGFTRTLSLLGRRVELRIEATSFEWRHGDDTTQQTDWPGKPWREGLSIDSYITHVYEHTGSVAPSVSVTWSAEYRVDNGPWLPVNGTVTRASQPTALEIVEAEPRLVAP